MALASRHDSMSCRPPAVRIVPPGTTPDQLPRCHCDGPATAQAPPGTSWAVAPALCRKIYVSFRRKRRVTHRGRGLVTPLPTRRRVSKAASAGFQSFPTWVVVYQCKAKGVISITVTYLGGDRWAAEVLIIKKALPNKLPILAWLLACDKLRFILVRER